MITSLVIFCRCYERLPHPSCDGATAHVKRRPAPMGPMRRLRIRTAIALVTVALAACASAQPANSLDPFTTDGCSIFPTGRRCPRAAGAVAASHMTSRIGAAALPMSDCWLIRNSALASCRRRATPTWPISSSPPNASAVFLSSTRRIAGYTARPSAEVINRSRPQNKTQRLLCMCSTWHPSRRKCATSSCRPRYRQSPHSGDVRSL